MPNPSRRTVLTNLATAAIGPVFVGRRAFAQNPSIRVDATALRQRIEALSRFGPAVGRDVRGRRQPRRLQGRRRRRSPLHDRLGARGQLKPRVDPAGNLRTPRGHRRLPTAHPLRFPHRLCRRRQLRWALGSLAALGASRRERRQCAHPPSAGDGGLGCEEGVAFNRGLTSAGSWRGT